MLKSIREKMGKNETEEENTKGPKNKTLKIVLGTECVLAVALVAVLVLHNTGVIGGKKADTSATTAEQSLTPEQQMEQADNSMLNIYAGFLDRTFATESGETFKFTPGENDTNGSFEGYVSKDTPNGTGEYTVTSDGTDYYVTITSGNTTSKYTYSLGDDGRTTIFMDEAGNLFELWEQ